MATPDKSRVEGAQITNVRKEVERSLRRLSPLFKDHCRLTFIMRNPQAEKGEMIITNDSLDDVRDVLTAATDNTEGE